MIREIAALMLLLAFIGINIAVGLGRLFGRFAGVTLRRVLGVDLPENEKKGLERLFTLVWVPIGIWAFLRLWNWSVSGIAGAVFGFLAFRSGANLTRTLVYSIHDRKILEEHGEGRLLSVIGKATGLSVLLEGTFAFSFALAYKLLSATITPGRSANQFILLLWLGGLAFGLFFGWFIARNNKGILLRNAILVVGFFAAKKGKSKVDGTVEKVGRVPRGFKGKGPRPPK